MQKNIIRKKDTNKHTTNATLWLSITIPRPEPQPGLQAARYWLSRKYSSPLAWVVGRATTVFEEMIPVAQFASVCNLMAPPMAEWIDGLFVAAL